MAQEQNDRNQTALYKQTDVSLEKRVADLVSRMTLKEKVSQMQFEAPAIERLGIPEYNWWNECLHGVARAGIATVFPQAIGLAATWNPDLVFDMASATSDEARAKHHEAVRQGDRAIYKGLTMWSPNINIFRDPRWGRGQETYGEDPYLTARMGVAFIKGLQGDDARYLKVVATPKHYAVHSGPEPNRHTFDAQTDERDLHETYLPAFKACVIEAKAVSVMGAYNRFRGQACCASELLLQKILRDDWGFEGYIVSDCGAIKDIWAHHKLVKTAPEAVALAVKRGCDLNCGDQYPHLIEAVEKGLITEEEIDKSVSRLFEARFRLGMFDPREMVPFAQIPFEINDCEKHDALALRTAQESIVLLKNENKLLPLKKNLKSIAVIGPNADVVDVLLGNYEGTPSHPVTPLKGIQQKVSPETEVRFVPGCNLTDSLPTIEPNEDPFQKAVDIATGSDVAIFVGGISAKLEGEEMESDATGFKGGDRLDLKLPEVQQKLLEAIHATGTPTVLVLMSGSALAVNWASENIPAIVQTWYPGQRAGTAIADVLFGDYNPAGRLPVTFYKSIEQLPPFEDYNMAGRTYRYFEGEALYPFGYGLSYTSFDYEKVEISPQEIKPGEPVTVKATVTNTGKEAGDEVVQLYLTAKESRVPVPLKSLKAFQRIHLEAGESKTVSFQLKPEDFSLIDEHGKRIIEAGEFEIMVGGDSQSGLKSGIFISPI